MSDDYSWTADLELEDLGKDTREAYYNAVEMRSNMNYIADSLERYSEAAPEERMELEGDINSKLETISDNIDSLEDHFEEKEKQGGELSETEEKAYSLLVPYYEEIVEEFSHLEDKIEETTSTDINPRDISPILRGNYEDTYEFMRTAEESDDIDPRVALLMSMR